MTVEKGIVLGISSLIEEVVKTGKCTKCGTCVSACPLNSIKIKGGVPALVGPCVYCGVCYDFCVRTFDAGDLIRSELLQSPVRADTIGDYRGVYSAKTKLEDVAKVAQDGGIVSSLLVYLFDKGLIDGAILTTSDDEWRPVPIVGRGREDVVRAAGTKYVMSPSMQMLRTAVYEMGMEKVAVVGVPCQITAISKMRVLPSLSDLGKRIFIAIGLFCMESFDYDKLMVEYLGSRGISPKDASKFAITKGRFVVYGKDGEVMLDVPIKEIKGIARGACHYCPDLTAEYADISVGSIGSPDGWSTVIVRSETGERIFRGAADEGYLEPRPIDEVKPGLDLLVKISRRKKESARKHIKAVESAQ